MNSKSINRNVWALTLSLCLGVIFTHATGYAAEERKGAVEVEDKRGPSLPCCECLGKSYALNLSTGTVPWQVSPGSGPTIVTVTSTLPGWDTLPGASWIQPSTSSSPGQFPANTTYNYTVKFNVPQKCFIPYEKFELKGNYAADNGAVFSLPTSGPALTASCIPSPASTDKKCFINPPEVLSWNGTLGTGLRTLTVAVKNEGGYSGLAMNAKLIGYCKK